MEQATVIAAKIEHTIKIENKSRKWKFTNSTIVAIDMTPRNNNTRRKERENNKHNLTIKRISARDCTLAAGIGPYNF